MKVAIDGPAGSGKSTVAHALAERCNLTFLDTGAMYRSVTVACIEAGVDVADADAVAEVAKGCRVTFGVAGDGSQTVFLNGRDVTRDIRTPEVDRNVSAVSAVPTVREAMVEQQRQIAGEKDVVAEGRDIGTVVFPDAEVKVFLTADPAARAHRRAVQRAGGDAATDPNASADAENEKAILADLERRDKLDSSRAVAPLRPAEDAHHIDSSNQGVQEVVDAIVALMEGARAQDNGTTMPEEKPRRRPRRDEAPEATERMRAFRGNTVDDYYDHPMRDFPWPSRALLNFVLAVVTFFTKILWPWRVEDGDKMWDGESGRMIVMNHTSMLDPVVLYCTAWAHGRRIRPIYKSEFDRVAIAKWFFSRVGAIPVERGEADIKAVRRAQRALQRGEDVLIYPEGTRVKSDDQPVELHAGFALMAQLAKAPVLPVAIVGARDITTPTRKIPHFHRVFLKVGDPITFQELGVKGRKKQCKEMERVAMGRVYELRAELRAEHPGKM